MNNVKRMISIDPELNQMLKDKNIKNVSAICCAALRRKLRDEPIPKRVAIKLLVNELHSLVNEN